MPLAHGDGLNDFFAPQGMEFTDLKWRYLTAGER